MNRHGKQDACRSHPRLSAGYRAKIALTRSLSSSVAKSSSQRTKQYDKPPRRMESSSVGQAGGRNEADTYSIAAEMAAAGAKLPTRAPQNRVWTFPKNHRSTINIEKKITPNPV